MTVREQLLSDATFRRDGTIDAREYQAGMTHSLASIAVCTLWRRSQGYTGEWYGCSIQELERAFEWWNARIHRLMHD